MLLFRMKVASLIKEAVSSIGIKLTFAILLMASTIPAMTTAADWAHLTDQAEPTPGVTGEGVQLPRFSGAVVVLVYHDVSPTETGPDTITPELLRSQLAYLKENGYHFISLPELARFYERQGDVPPNAVTVTFDDGYKSFYTYAAPVLEELEIPAASFVIVANSDGLNHLHHIPSLTWDEMRGLERTGLFLFEPHTFSSHFLVSETRLWWTRQRPALVAMVDPRTGRIESREAHHRRILADLQRAREGVESQLGGWRVFFAWPYGAHDAAADRAADEVGFQLAFGVKPGFVRPGENRLGLPRINAGAPYISTAYLARSLDAALRTPVPRRILAPARPPRRLTRPLQTVGQAKDPVQHRRKRTG